MTTKNKHIPPSFPVVTLKQTRHRVDERFCRSESRRERPTKHAFLFSFEESQVRLSFHLVRASCIYMYLTRLRRCRPWRRWLPRAPRSSRARASRPAAGDVWSSSSRWLYVVTFPSQCHIFSKWCRRISMPVVRHVCMSRKLHETF